ncbi:MAG TPA: hypothetical protein VIZ28_01155 [Chitinophagaceae bacterium]
MLVFIRKIRITAFVSTLIIYFSVFFLLNFYFDEIKLELGKKLYYFLYTFFEYSTFAYILWKFIDNKKFRTLIVVCSIAFTSFLIFFFSTIRLIRTVDSVPIGVETILIFLYIFYFFYQYFKNTTISILNDHSFWLVTGILAYLGSTFFFNILADNINRVEFERYWYLTYLGDIIKNILSAVAVILYAKNPDVRKDQKPSSVPYLDMI